MKLDHYLRADHADVARVAAELEALGFDGLYTAEGPHEPFLSLALAAEHTTRATLFTNIAVAFARSPMDLAQTANDLQLSSGGRFVLGVGSQIRPHIQNRFSMPWHRPRGACGSSSWRSKPSTGRGTNGSRSSSEVSSSRTR